MHTEQPNWNASTLSAATAGGLASHERSATDAAAVAAVAQQRNSALTGGNAPSSARQKQNQQQLLRLSVSGSGSVVAAVRQSPERAAAARAASGTEDTRHSVQLPSLPTTTNSDAYLLDGYDGAHSDSLQQQQTPPSGTAPLPTPPGNPFAVQQEAGLTPIGEDFVHEILAMNTLAMEECHAAMDDTAASFSSAEEAMRVLSEAFMRLDDVPAQDLPAALLNELKSTTLNNMGVVECNRGQPRQALSHFEAARQLEENNDMASPSVALNTCAAYNALHMYDKATAAALEAIDMLRALEAQRQRSRRAAAAVARQLQQQQSIGYRGTSAQGEMTDKDTDLILEAAAAPQIAESQNAALWGAAWNNLTVAQINTARGVASKDTSEYTNILILFQNAMQATQDLLGAQHPMTRAVVETYRSVRRALRHRGAFKQHRTLLRAPLPPVDPREQSWEEAQVEAAPGLTRHSTKEKQRQQLTITFRGDVTRWQKLVERVDSTPYPGATTQPYQVKKSSARGGSSTRGGPNKSSRGTASRKTNAALLRGMPLSETLARASDLYGNPHPLLYSPPPPPPPPEQVTGGSAPPSLMGSARTSRDTDTTRRARKRNGRAAVVARDGARAGRKIGPHSVPQNPDPGRSQRGSTRTPNSARLAPGVFLPPIVNGQAVGSFDMTATGGEDDWANRTDGTTASSVFMHHPPLAAAYDSPAGTGIGNTAAAAVAQLQQSKMLLLASPPTAAAGDGTSSAPHRASAGSASSSSLLSVPHLATTKTQKAGETRDTVPTRPTKPPTLDGAATTNQLATTSPQQGNPHALFRGMWVTADPQYVHRGPRVFGKLAYYTISSAVNVDDNGVTQGTPTAGVPVASSMVERTERSSVSALSRPALPTLTYSSGSDSDAEDDDGDDYDDDGDSDVANFQPPHSHIGNGEAPFPEEPPANGAEGRPVPHRGVFAATL